MDLTNRSYVIRLRGKRWTERYVRDEKGWMKMSARRRRFRLTAEQVLNHLLPALSGVKPGVAVDVEHRPPKERPAASTRRRRRQEP